MQLMRPMTNLLMSPRFAALMLRVRPSGLIRGTGLRRLGTGETGSPKFRRNLRKTALPSLLVTTSLDKYLPSPSSAPPIQSLYFLHFAASNSFTSFAPNVDSVFLPNTYFSPSVNLSALKAFSRFSDFSRLIVRLLVSWTDFQVFVTDLCRVDNKDSMEVGEPREVWEWWWETIRGDAITALNERSAGIWLTKEGGGAIGVYSEALC